MILAKEEEGFHFSSTSFVKGTVKDFLKNAGAQFRVVELKDQWWKYSYDNMLGFYEESGQPVALIHRGEATYDLVTPNTLVQQVDALIHQSLAKYAYVIVPTPKKNLNSFFKIFVFCSRKTSREYVMMFLTGIAASSIMLFFPFANKLIFDQILPNFNISLLVQVLLGLLLVSISTSIFLLLRAFFMIRLNGIVENNVQFLVWQKIFKLPLSFFRSFSTGDLLQRTMILEQARRHFNDSIIRIIMNGFFSFIYLFIMFFFSWELALIVLQVICITAVVAAIVTTLRLKYIRKQLAIGAKINGFLVQVISGISKLRVAGSINRIFSLWAKDFAISQTLQFRAQKLQNYLITWVTTAQLLIPLIIFTGIAYALKVTGNIPISIGSFLGFYSAMSLFTTAIFDMAAQIPFLTNLIPFLERSKVLFQTPQEDNDDLPPPGSLFGEVKIENLFFRYSNSSPYILENTNLLIPKGSWVGITGPSGCGKSTLCRLIVGLEKLQQGRISFDGKDSSGLSPSALREQMGILLQTSSAIFAGSIYDNILCGHNYSMDEINETMEQTEFVQELQELPMGLNTLLPRGGTVLSGGQRQKLLLTRVLIRKPKILILDEAINALDWPAQEKILNRIAELKITKIVISHSPRLLKYADVIYNERDLKFSKK